MFQNIGEKLKVAAEVLFVIGVIALLLVVIFGTGQLLVGIIIFVPGALVLWLATALLYAFGDLVGNVQVIKDYMQTGGSGEES